MTIETTRLRLLPYAPEHLLALIEGEERFEESFGMPAAAGLRDFIVSDEVSPAWLAISRSLPFELSRISRMGLGYGNWLNSAPFAVLQR